MHKDLLYKSSHFNAAIENKWHVAVYQQDEILDEGGVIESQTLESIKINGNYFMKANCQFVIVGDERIEGDIVDLNKIKAFKANDPEVIAFIENGVLHRTEK